eukprot:TRINITY_DN80511_c0_g1_i1.p1 TRINITY_DN80511_c0_g1~~TRINITY_DN80511_c0_g1_i1.p1  ORF type:complete len:218 (+),score=42.08 TRINITY_DN80511_c0_g1_i1:60-713(+)
MALLEGGKAYYLGACSRSPFDPARFPLSLNALGGRARLDNFDAAAGNLWQFRFVGGHASVFSEPRMLTAATAGPGSAQFRRSTTPTRGSDEAEASQGQRCFTLACINYVGSTQSTVYLGPELNVVADEGRAQLWQGVPHPSWRCAVPGEVALQIRAHGSDKLLCSDDRRRNIYLLKPADSAMLDPATGMHVFNDAWEATPDEDPPADLMNALLERLS